MIPRVRAWLSLVPLIALFLVSFARAGDIGVGFRREIKVQGKVYREGSSIYLDEVKSLDVGVYTVVRSFPYRLGGNLKQLKEVGSGEEVRLWGRIYADMIVVLRTENLR
jgi:hypothetical protein